jgi:predicted secreted hydrolase
VPTTWRVQLPEKALDITATALNPQSWMNTTISYWEGPVRVTGTHPGRGYLEMTGYE